MRLKYLLLKQFRKISDQRFDFNSGIVVFMGPNAMGKTTVLEAIHFLMTGQSFRTSRSQDLYQEGSRRFDLACEYEKEGETNRLSVTMTPQSKEITYYSGRSSHLNVLLGNIIGSLLTPDDVHLVKGSPQARRMFLDLQISETDPFYSWHLSRYNRAMRQRNALLKGRHFAACAGWEQEMALSAAYITEARREAVKRLQPLFEKGYGKLQEAGESVELSYLTQQKEPGAAFFVTEWARTREREGGLGFTLLGPHKDDLEIYIDKKEAKHFGSEGQKQTLLLALKWAEWQRLYDLTGEKPLFMIDDVGVSLDSTRRKRLFEEAASMGQVFMTTTDSRDFPLADIQIIPF